MKRTKPYRNGKVHVLSEKCSTCIFRPGNLMNLEPGRVRQMVDDSLREDTAIICHETLGRAQAVCRDFFDMHWRDTLPLRAAVALKLLEEVCRGVTIFVVVDKKRKMKAISRDKLW